MQIKETPKLLIETIELKSIHHSPSLSEETEAFTANVHINGKMAFTAQNWGNGGQTDFDPLIDKKSGNYSDMSRMLIEGAKEYADSLPSVNYGDGFYLPIDLELLIGYLLEKYLNGRNFKKMTDNGKTTLFRSPGDEDGIWKTFSHPFTPEVKAYCLEKYPEATFYNERNPEDFAPIHRAS